MRYLIRPSAQEELSVRGRYEWRTPEGALVASEAWERYTLAGGAGQAWRSEWQGDAGALLSHLLLSEAALERLKLRWLSAGRASQEVTLTLESDSLLVRDGDELREVALPPGYGLTTPLPSLARLAFPFDLASEQRELAMTWLVRQGHAGLTMRPTKFGYLSLGLRELEVKGEVLRAKGWRMEVPGLPPVEAWFERNGSCLRWAQAGQPEARLVEWIRFG